MQIGYSEETLRFNIATQIVAIEEELEWLKYYYSLRNDDCVEDCTRNIQDSLVAILENVENLKGKSL